MCHQNTKVLRSVKRCLFWISEASILITRFPPVSNHHPKEVLSGSETWRQQILENFRRKNPVGDLTVSPRIVGIDNLKSILARKNHSSRTQTSPSLSQLGKCETQFLFKIVLWGVELRNVSNNNTLFNMKGR